MMNRRKATAATAAHSSRAKMKTTMADDDDDSPKKKSKKTTRNTSLPLVATDASNNNAAGLVTIEKQQQRRRRKKVHSPTSTGMIEAMTVLIFIIALGIAVFKAFWIGFNWASNGSSSSGVESQQGRNSDGSSSIATTDTSHHGHHDVGLNPKNGLPKYPILETKATTTTSTSSSNNNIELSQEAIDMCTQALWHTLETTTIVLPDSETFVHTGDIDDLWLRDSAAQVHTLLIPTINNIHNNNNNNGGNNGDRYNQNALMSADPQLDRIVAGLIKRTAMYIRHDPYANAFRIDDTYVFSNEQKAMGRHDLISTWNYELDSGCYYIRMLYMYWKQTSSTNAMQKSVLHLPQVIEAVDIMITLWKAEQRHEDDMYPKGELLDCQNCGKPYRYPTLKIRHGKGSPTNATSGLTWTGFRPSDDECQYHFLIPANMFAVVALEYVVELNDHVWKDTSLGLRAANLAKSIQRGIEEHGIVDHPKWGKIYAYEVDGLGNHNLMDDANVPSLLSIPYLGYPYYDPEVYDNTRKFIFSTDNPTYQSGTNAMTGKLEGYGSPHMSARIRKNIWPMSIAMQGLVEPDPHKRAELVETLVKASAGTHWMHESINVQNPKDYTRSWFCWADALFAELVMSLTDKCPDPNHKYRVMEWRDPQVVEGGPFADS